jgi:hypothetical protein
VRTNGPIFAGASDDPSMPATLVAILSLLPRTAAPFLRGAWVEHAAFFSIGLIAAQFTPNPITPLTKLSRGGDRRQDDVAVTQLASALMQPWSTTVETGGVMDWWTKLEEGGDHASKAVA